MAYVIIGFVLLLIIVPIFSVLPNARQRQQMAMRKAARAAGVSVELTTITDPNPGQDKYTSHLGKKLEPNLKVVAYRVQRRRPSDWRQLPQVNWCMKKDLEGRWHWDGHVNKDLSDELRTWLEDNVDTLPADVEQVEEVSYNVTIYWHERTNGDEEKVFGFLKECMTLPLHRPQADD